MVRVRRVPARLLPALRPAGASSAAGGWRPRAAGLSWRAAGGFLLPELRPSPGRGHARPVLAASSAAGVRRRGSAAAWCRWQASHLQPLACVVEGLAAWPVVGLDGLPSPAAQGGRWSGRQVDPDSLGQRRQSGRASPLAPGGPRPVPAVSRGSQSRAHLRPQGPPAGRRPLLPGCRRRACPRFPPRGLLPALVGRPRGGEAAQRPGPSLLPPGLFLAVALPGDVCRATCGWALWPGRWGRRPWRPRGRRAGQGFRAGGSSAGAFREGPGQCACHRSCSLVGSWRCRVPTG